jgi:NmrA-like family protein
VIGVLGSEDHGQEWPCYLFKENHMAEKKIIAVMGATGSQGGGLVRAILSAPNGRFAARAITRKTDSEKARALAAAGAEVVAGDADDQASIERAFTGAHGAFLVTNFWEHFSAERELKQAAAMARATKAAGVAHAVWSTLARTPASPSLSTIRASRRSEGSTRCRTSTPRESRTRSSPPKRRPRAT